MDSGPCVEVVVEVRPARRNILDLDARQGGAAGALATSGHLIALTGALAVHRRSALGDGAISISADCAGPSVG